MRVDSTQDPIEVFAREAMHFRQWVDKGMAEGPSGALAALQRLSELYSAGLRLPMVTIREDAPMPAMSRGEWRRVNAAAGVLPLDLYAVIDDPADVLPDGTSMASLGTDIADIYRDVVGALRLFERGHRNAAVWYWRLSLRAHWGWHATSALHALQGWINELGSVSQSSRGQVN